MIIPSNNGDYFMYCSFVIAVKKKWKRIKRRGYNDMNANTKINGF